MAPSLSTATGVPEQILDDPRLVKLHREAHDLKLGDADALVALLRPWQEWVFEEQVDLHGWIHLLNAVDVALRGFLDSHPALILLKHVERKAVVEGRLTAEKTCPPSPPESLADVEAVPPSVTQNVQILLCFLGGILKHCCSKAVFNSVDELVDLLGAADDNTADLALEVLRALAAPVDIHRQQSPEAVVHSHPSAIHNAKTCHSRVLALAKGWGTRSEGVGLLDMVTTDDSVHGQGNLPSGAGHVNFSFYQGEDLTEVGLSEADMVSSTSSRESTSMSKKRRRIGGGASDTKSTAELFFMALERIGGRRKLPEKHAFALLADIRLARGFYSQAARQEAIERRLRALSTILNAQPMQDAITGYFQAQPELNVEIVDLLRPTVSSAYVSPASMDPNVTDSPLHRDAVAGLSTEEPVPFEVRVAALDALVALVCRRDGASGSSSSGRLSNLLGELGVSKGQYLGLLPTMIRYSLTCLGSPVTFKTERATNSVEGVMDTDSPALEIGLALVEAMREPLLPRSQQVERALVLIEKVLALTATVVTSPTGTSALTDCGLIPSLLATVTVDPDIILRRLLPDFEGLTTDVIARLKALLRFITALAVQILEGAVVTHSNALTSFHEVKGLEALTTRLAIEMYSTDQNEDAMDLDEKDSRIRPSQRVLLVAIVTCTAVIFHQQSTASTATTLVPTSSEQIKSEGLTKALINIMEDTSSYGGHLASLTATLLSDVMNSDPQIVRYVHESGIASAFLKLLLGRPVKDDLGNDVREPTLPPVPEMIMAVPNVIAALSLTDDGAKKILEVNPFPALLRLFYHPNYAMPRSRCLLNEMTAIVGTGLDEIMRHVELLKPIILESIAKAIKDVVQYAEDLKRRELSSPYSRERPDLALEEERSCLIQYVLNFGQLLEQLLHNDENCEPFVKAGGLDALLHLFSSSLPSGRRFLSLVCGLSAPSVSTLHHSTIEDSLLVAFKCIEFKHEAAALLKKIANTIGLFLDRFEGWCGNATATTLYWLDPVPNKLLYEVESDEATKVSNLLECVTNLEWLCSLLTSVLKAISQKREHGGWSAQQEREWKKVFASVSFSEMFQRLSTCFSTCSFEVCRFRAHDFECDERRRMTNGSPDVSYRIRIVCPEGAVVRDGIDIDSCANVGCMEMGEVVDACSRCVNASGVLRYRTPNGWVSEMTRGQAREPIAEVVHFWKDPEKASTTSRQSAELNILQAGVPTLRTVTIGVLAKMQECSVDLYGSLSKVLVCAIRNLSPSSLSFDEVSSNGGHIATLSRLLSKSLKSSFNFDPLLEMVRRPGSATDAGAALYLGCLIRQVHCCLFEEKRERNSFNFPLLIHVLGVDQSSSDEGSEQTKLYRTFGLLDAVAYLFQFCLSSGWVVDGSKYKRHVSRVVASSLPPTINMLRRLVSTPISNSPVVTVMRRISWEDVSRLMGFQSGENPFLTTEKPEDLFQPDVTWKELQVLFSDTIRKLWSDDRLREAPPHIVYPLTGLIIDSICALEGSLVQKASTSTDGNTGTRLRDLLRQRMRDTGRFGEQFEASEEAIQSLAEMGFTRDHALDAIESTRSNRIEVAMEYALSHPPPSPGSAARRREARARQQRTSRDETNEVTGSPADPSESTNDSRGSRALQKDEKVEEKQGDSCSQRVKASIDTWLDNAGPICVDILRHDGPSSGQEEVTGDREALTTILSCFLLDLCNRYPKRQQNIICCVVDNIRGVLVLQGTEGQASELSGAKEQPLASLCHALLLMLRAIPSTRKFVLEKGLLRPLVAGLTSIVGKQSGAPATLPAWVAPALLLMDTMAQPLILFSRDELKIVTDDSNDELSVVLKQHRTQVDDLANGASQLLRGSSQTPNRDATDSAMGFEKVPAYYPLLPLDCARDCLEICQNLTKIAVQPNCSCIPPGVLHATLSLFIQLLRSPDVSSACLKSGVALAILSLPKESRFVGNAGMVASVMRRFLEDKVNLQSAMETELRSAVTKLIAKSSGDQRVKLSSLLENVAPLIYRDPQLFIDAMAKSLKIDHSDTVWVRLTPAESDEKSSMPSDAPAGSEIRAASVTSPSRRRRSGSAPKDKGKGKSQARKRSSSRKHKKENSDAKTPNSADETAPAQVIIPLLIRSIIEGGEKDVLADNNGFLGTSDLLDILADLVLAVPACASAVHNFRPRRGRDKTLSWVDHALDEAPAPSRTFVSYLLHVLLPQNRWELKCDMQLREKVKLGDLEKKEVIDKKKRAARITKLVQSTARLLVALVARPGTGRKRAIADIAFALSGGIFGSGEKKTGGPIMCRSSPRGLHALLAWGELCLGLAAPKTSGTTMESNVSLSVDIVKNMMEQGIAHSLMQAIHLVPLHHPMALMTCSTLLMPFELLTRPTVVDSIKTSSEDDSPGPNMHSVLETDTALSSADPPLEGAPDFGILSSNHTSTSEDQNSQDSMEDEDLSEEEDDEESTDTEMEDEDHDDEDLDSELDEDEDVSSTEVDDQGEWNVDYRNAVGHHADHLDFGGASDGESNRGEQPIEEGWTRVDTSGFGGMVLGRLPEASAQGGSRRGFIDAAESMIGSLLRNGDISQETIDEIEGSLGINLNGGNGPRASVLGAGTRQGFNSRALQNPDSRPPSAPNAVGTLPQIHQRLHRDMSYSTSEIVFGGPAVTSRIRDYDTSPMHDLLEESPPSLSHLDLQLFPGGPYAAASPQTYQLLHPLLRGVNLPPANALVSELLPHGIRSTRRSDSTPTGLGDRIESNLVPGFLLSTVDGHIMHTSHPHGGSGSRSPTAPIGWTDYGVPLDNRLRTALQEAISDALANANQEEEAQAMDTTHVESDEPNTSQRQSENSSVGEAVASSLATGLRLSSASEGPDDAEMNEASQLSVPDASSPETAPAPDTETNDMESGVSQASDDQIGDESGEAAADTSGSNNAELGPDSGVTAPNVSASNDLTCPPGVDEDVFNSLPREMQQDCVDQYNATRRLTEELDGSTLDPEALAALPDDLREEVLAQERQRQQAEAPADPSHAEEMDNASFLVSLAPELREDILVTADEEFLASLPPSVVAEAHILRERASARQRGMYEDQRRTDGTAAAAGTGQDLNSTRRRQRSGKIRVELERDSVLVTTKSLPPVVAASDLKMLFRLLYLSSTLRPRILQRVLFNLSMNVDLRRAILATISHLLSGDTKAANGALESYAATYRPKEEWRPCVDGWYADEFPPARLISRGDAPESEFSHPVLSKTWSGAKSSLVPPAVVSRLLDVAQHLLKSSPRIAVYTLSGSPGKDDPKGSSCFDSLLDLLEQPAFLGSSTTLEQLLTLLETAVSPLSHLSKVGEESKVSEQDVEAALVARKEWVYVPRVAVTQHRLKLLCAILRMETCRDSSFTKVNTIVRRLCRIEANRAFVLSELATVARSLGSDAVKDLRALRVKMDDAASRVERNCTQPPELRDGNAITALSGSVTLSTSASELKLLRVLQTLQALCIDSSQETAVKKYDQVTLVTSELIELLGQLHFDDLWQELSGCLNVVQVLEGIASEEATEKEDMDRADDASGEDKKKVLRNNAAGLLTRFLPSIEAFFITTGSASRSSAGAKNVEIALDQVVNGKELLKFVATNKVLVNALVRNNSSLLEKGFRVLVQIPRCRAFLDFDVKRQWFKTQVRRLRQQASRRHGSLRLHIRRRNVFEDAYHQLRLRNAEEMRGRLHITFRNEAGVDAGGLSREFFGILAKEMFNPNYALFTSTEDGCTFQPNPNSSINPDHLSYFRFVGRIVGKAVSDGYLLDAHFTRSLYKHMLGLEPTYQDMEAIDQDYYRNLKTILDYDLADIGLDLTFSVEDHSFGRKQEVDLIPNGRSIPVTEENKEDYVRKICQHRMTTAIQNQIKAYLDGFHELVSPELVAIFTPGELELLISGLPEIDISDLKRNTDFVGWKATDKQMEWFWNVMFSLSRNEKASFLQFVTGSSKVPLAGFSDLQGMRGVQKFSIHKVEGKKGSLVSAHTCFNSLDFPVYDSEEELRKKLLTAINEGNGSFMIA